MRIQLTTKLSSEVKEEVLVLPVFTEEKLDFQNPVVEEFLKDNPKFGKPYEYQFLYTSTGKILLVGLGKKEKLNFEAIQNWSGTAAKTLLTKAREIALVLPLGNISSEDAIYAAGLGLELASHDPSRDYKTEEELVILNNALILVDRNLENSRQALKKAQIVSEAMNLARKLGDMPGNDMTPTYFVNAAKKIARDCKLKLTVLDEEQAKKIGMGGFTAVARGSEEPSYMIALEYNGNKKSKEKWGLVGKGLTFDSGGISIKPGDAMTDMKYDMSGAGSVLAAVWSIARLEVKVNVVAVCAVTENLPSGKALKPGDIVKTYSGKTAEILNTDAEGRVVLADALTFARKDFKATKLIDLATLTGALIVALGDLYSGVFTNNQQLADSLIEDGKKTGERYWQLPMDEAYDEMIKSDIADMTNIGHGGSMRGAAGSITGAKFLEQVVEKQVPWVHLDIAGTAWDLKPKPYRGPGATGFGVKTLVELVSKSG
ncbi:MAG: leucyl aminopeptidase [Armatimonadetes bacterium]|nr:MAG: leucyl aminopeptidase [Armatimonadota bacterium]